MEFLEQLEAASLFLIPLDDERHWFRYHHLFGGLLRHELARTAPQQPSSKPAAASAQQQAQGVKKA